MAHTEKKCAYCDKVLDPLRGRADRIFCNDSCRSAYHNKKKQQMDPEIIRINKILELNFEILQKILGSSKTVSRSREELLRLGFSFDYYTQVSGEYKFCYGYGYISRHEKYVMIVRGFAEIVKKI